MDFGDLRSAVATACAAPDNRTLIEPIATILSAAPSDGLGYNMWLKYVYDHMGDLPFSFAQTSHRAEIVFTNPMHLSYPKSFRMVFQGVKYHRTLVDLTFSEAEWLFGQWHFRTVLEPGFEHIYKCLRAVGCPDTRWVNKFKAWLATKSSFIQNGATWKAYPPTDFDMGYWCSRSHFDARYIYDAIVETDFHKSVQSYSRAAQGGHKALERSLRQHCLMYALKQRGLM